MWFFSLKIAVLFRNSEIFPFSEFFGKVPKTRWLRKEKSFFSAESRVFSLFVKLKRVELNRVGQTAFWLEREKLQRLSIWAVFCHLQHFISAFSTLFKFWIYKKEKMLHFNLRKCVFSDHLETGKILAMGKTRTISTSSTGRPVSSSSV